MTEADHHPLLRLETLVLIAIGGFAGSNLRYFADVLLPGMIATLAVNVLGSFVFGFILYEAIRSGVLANETRIVVSTGFISSFTTYSTFALQSVQASPLWMILNVITTYALGFIGVLTSRLLADAVDHRWS